MDAGSNPKDIDAIYDIYGNGAMGSMNVTMLTYPQNYEGSITILGENGTVQTYPSSILFRNVLHSIGLILLGGQILGRNAYNIYP